MEYIPGTVNARPRPIQPLAVPSDAPRRRPVPVLPSHKDTTCNFWARGDCRYTEEECQYAHSWTDLAGGQLNTYHPGRPQVPQCPQMAGLNARSATANTQVQQGVVQSALSDMHFQQDLVQSALSNMHLQQGNRQPALSNMHIQQGDRQVAHGNTQARQDNMQSTPGNTQARPHNMQPSPIRPRMSQGATLLNPERLVRQSRGISDPRGNSDPRGFSDLGRFNPVAEAFEPQYLRELRLERDRSQAFFTSMNAGVGLFLKLSEELETTMVDLHHLSNEVRAVAEAIQNWPVDLQLQSSRLRRQATEIEAMAVTHETWNELIEKEIGDAGVCWKEWEGPTRRRP